MAAKGTEPEGSGNRGIVKMKPVIRMRGGHPEGSEQRDKAKGIQHEGPSETGTVRGNMQEGSEQRDKAKVFSMGGQVRGKQSEGTSKRDPNRGIKPNVFSMGGQVRGKQSEGTSKSYLTRGVKSKGSRLRGQVRGKQSEGTSKFLSCILSYEPPPTFLGLFLSLLHQVSDLNIFPPPQVQF